MKLFQNVFEQVAQRIRGSVSSKQYGLEDLLCPLIAKACIEVCPKNANNFSVDNVRVVKIPGGGAYDSTVVKGLVLKRGAEGTIKIASDAKVAVFAQGVDTSSTETKVRGSDLGYGNECEVWVKFGVKDGVICLGLVVSEFESKVCSWGWVWEQVPWCDVLGRLGLRFPNWDGLWDGL